MSDSPTNVVVLPGLGAPPGHTPLQAEVIERLEEFLEQARAGKLIAFAWAATSNDHMIRTGWSGDVSRELVGYGISKLSHSYYTACVDDD